LTLLFTTVYITENNSFNDIQIKIYLTQQVHQRTTVDKDIYEKCKMQTFS